MLQQAAICPDVLEMPYRPPLRDGFEAQENLILIDSLQILVLQGISLGITALKNRLKLAIASILKTWLFTHLSK